MGFYILSFSYIFFVERESSTMAARTWARSRARRWASGSARGSRATRRSRRARTARRRRRQRAAWGCACCGGCPPTWRATWGTSPARWPWAAPAKLLHALNRVYNWYYSLLMNFFLHEGSYTTTTLLCNYFKTFNYFFFVVSSIFWGNCNFR